jgi:predicted GIY-YIG superfamily endonuclease
MGIVYLLHFDQPYQHAQHYLGYTDDIDQRMATHRAGNGARLMEVIGQAGINWRLARTWEGDKELERQLKRRHNSPQLCPICQAKAGKSPF